jgi:hypothetical protein
LDIVVRSCFMSVFGTLNVNKFWFDVFGSILNVVLAIQFRKTVWKLVVSTPNKDDPKLN